MDAYLAKHFPNGVPDSLPTANVLKTIGDDMLRDKLAVPSWDTPSQAWPRPARALGAPHNPHNPQRGCCWMIFGPRSP
jgi:hypothetical protein